MAIDEHGVATILMANVGDMSVWHSESGALTLEFKHEAGPWRVSVSILEEDANGRLSLADGVQISLQTSLPSYISCHLAHKHLDLSLDEARFVLVFSENNLMSPYMKDAFLSYISANAKLYDLKISADGPCVTIGCSPENMNGFLLRLQDPSTQNSLTREMMTRQFRAHNSDSPASLAPGNIVSLDLRKK